MRFSQSCTLVITLVPTYNTSPSPPSLSDQDYPAIPEGLDLVQEDDQITHLLSLSDAHDGEDLLNVFQEDSDYLANEDKYKEIKAGMYVGSAYICDIIIAPFKLLLLLLLLFLCRDFRRGVVR